MTTEWVSLLFDRTLSSNAFRLYQYLWWRQGQNGSAWPSQKTIGRDLGLSKKTVLKTIIELEKRGVLKRQRPKSYAPGRTNRYRLNGSKNYPRTGGKNAPRTGGNFGTQSKYNEGNSISHGELEKDKDGFTPRERLLKEIVR